MITSCGLILTDKKKILMCKNTGYNAWDLPKGKQEEGESPIEACVREVREETGLELSDKKDLFIDLGLFYYVPTKRLHLFLYVVDKLPDINSLFCTSYFQNKKDGTLTPEMDTYKYIDIPDIKSYARNKMSEILYQVLDYESEDTYQERLRFAMGHILRHNPDKHHLEIDKYGYTPIDDFLKVIRNYNISFENAQIEDIENVLKNDTRNRFSIKNGKIKANYGHSIPVEYENTPIEPPEYLYHGTNDFVLKSIVQEGLKPMNRKFVHLAVNQNDAYFYCNKLKYNVLYNRRYWPVLLRVKAKEAYKDGILFYKEAEDIYVSEPIPWKYIERIKLPE